MYYKYDISQVYFCYLNQSGLRASRRQSLPTFCSVKIIARFLGLKASKVETHGREKYKFEIDKRLLCSYQCSHSDTFETPMGICTTRPLYYC